MNVVLVGMLAYVLVQFAIGAWVSRRMTNESDYILAGRRLGVVLVVFSVFAYAVSASVVQATWHNYTHSFYTSRLLGTVFYFALSVAFGYALMPDPVLMQSTAVVGVWGITLLAFLVFAAPVLLVRTGERGRGGGRRPPPRGRPPRPR